MDTRLPPLNALRAFESAARRGGFAAAAQELHVTPTAVSHQVKALEGYLNVRLFNRLPRGLELTEAGRELLPQLSRGFDHLARAVVGLTAGGLGGRLIVSAIPSFSSLWLVPRLDSFLKAYPEIEVRVIASFTALDLNTGEVDVRIPYGLGTYPGFNVRPLMREEIFPVGAPTLLNQLPLRRFSDLRQHTLLHDINVGTNEPIMTWKRWFQEAGLSEFSAARSVEFSDAMLLTEAAVRGQGVALGRTSLVKDHLATGRLLRPLKVAQPADYAYYTVTTQPKATHPRVQAFIQWIEAQVEEDSARGEN